MNDVKKEIEIALNYFTNNDFPAAEHILKKIIKAFPTNSTANEYLAYIYGNKGKLEHAYKLLEMACRQKECSAEAIYYLGSLQLKKLFYIEAINSFEKAIKKRGPFFEVLYDLGTAYANLQKFEISLLYYKRCLIIDDKNHELHYNLARCLDDLHHFNESLIYYNKAIQLKPDFIEAWINKGKTLHDLLRYEDAINSFDQAILLDPCSSMAWVNKGLTLFQLKRFDEALEHYEKAIQLKPDFAEAWCYKAILLHELKIYHEAIEHYEKAIQLKPDFTEAWINISFSYFCLKRYENSLACAERALQLNPELADAWNNRGNALHGLKRYSEALVCYEKTLQLKPDLVDAWTNRGNSFYSLGYYEEALTHHEKAIQLKPDFAAAWRNKGLVLNDLKRFDEAVAHYQQALTLDPSIDWAHGDLLHTKMRICDWSNFSISLEKLTSEVEAGNKSTAPFILLALTDNSLLQKKCSEIYCKSFHPFKPELGPISKQIKKNKICIGYFSADFRDHAVSRLIVELFELHDKNKFEIIAFSFSFSDEDKSQIRLRLNQAFDKFIDVSNMSDLEVTKLSRELGVDIAVDLTGLTANSRLSLFSYRVAPIQVNYLGYPGTIDNKLDYIICDKTLVTKKTQQFYFEKIIYLPNSYQVNDRKRPIASKEFSRQELGLPENGFIFCCFNNNFKILPTTFDSWMRILKTVEDSVLWLFEDNIFSAVNLKNEAKNQGVDPKRIIFANRLTNEEHLARHIYADLFLDTYPYNAHTTASDALWAGLPVLTLMGQSFASRVAASLLYAIGLPELVTTTQSEYESLAINLATDTKKLANIKKILSKNRLNTPLFDTPLFARHIENAYCQIYERHQANLSPNHIYVEP